MRALLLVCSVCLFRSLPVVQAEEASTLHPSDVGRRADRAFHAWAYQEALALYRREPTTNRTVVAYVRMGDCLFHLGRYDEAEKEYQDCLKNFPKGSGHTFIYTHLADCYVALGRLDEARQLYRRAQDFYKIDFDTEARIEWLRKKAPNKSAEPTPTR